MENIIVPNGTEPFARKLAIWFEGSECARARACHREGAEQILCHRNAFASMRIAGTSPLSKRIGDCYLFDFSVPSETDKITKNYSGHDPITFGIKRWRFTGGGAHTFPPSSPSHRQKLQSGAH